MRHISNLWGLVADALKALFSHGVSAAPAEEERLFSGGASAASVEEEITHYSPEYCSLIQRHHKSLTWNDVPDVKEEFIRKEMKKCNDVRAAHSKKGSSDSATVSA